MRSREIAVLFAKDLKLEFRQMSALNSILLYMASTLFICYLALGQAPNPATWTALFWLIMLFSATNAVSRGLYVEHNDCSLFYGVTVAPLSLIISRLLYNGLLSIILCLLTYALMSLLFGNPVQSQFAFILGMCLGAIGFSSLLTFVTAIAFKAGKLFTMAAILGFPLCVPIILTTIEMSNACMGVQTSYDLWAVLLILGLLDLILILLACLLFPFLWKD
jgi:heme exporter protein B